jgi:hypothetical protein
LEENILRLQSRIHQLEHQHQTAGPPIPLVTPYHRGRTQILKFLYPCLLILRTVGTPGPNSGQYSNSMFASSEPPPDVTRALWVFHTKIFHILNLHRLNTFLPLASEFGFFLNGDKFFSSASQPLPIGHPSRPSSALLVCVYLWGIRLSDNPNLRAQEPNALSRAVQEVSGALSSSHPQKEMHTLQAQLLLATYFFSSGRLVEGQYHVSSASSLAMSIGLHHQYPLVNTTIPPSRDSIEDGERILAMWTVLLLDKSWALALDAPPNIPCCIDDDTVRIETPWPLEVQEYEKVCCVSAEYIPS